MSDLNKCELAPSGNVLTPRGRFWFLAIAEKFVARDSKKKDDTGAYIATLVVPPDADLTVLKDMVKEAATAEFGNKLPGNLKKPIRLCKEVFNKDGDPKYPPEMDNWFQITANTYKQQPGVVDAKRAPISKLRPDESTDDLKARLEEECYSGRWGRMSVSGKGYDVDGNKGVKLYLQNIQVLDHDERIGGGGRNVKAEDDFAEVEGVETGASSGGSSDDLWD